jgi:hypothetical protein
MTMKSYFFITLIFILFFSGCDSKKPETKKVAADKNSVTGILINPDVLSCNDVWISVDGKRTERTTFYYGELFSLNFINMAGFNKVDGSVFPGISLKVTNEGGDTIFKDEDIYADSVNGINISPVLLKIDYTVEKPVHSNYKYTLHIKIRDKLGEGIFITNTPFNVIENDRISIEKKYIDYGEIYLFSANRNKVITDGEIVFNEIVYLVFEGLSGFYERNGRVYPGSAVRAVDNLNAPVMYFDDLFKSYNTTGVNSTEFKQRIYVKMSFTGFAAENPVHCEAVIFDKKRNEAYIKVATDVNIRQEI